MKDHPVQPGEFWPDLAWPFYPLRQAWADLARIEAERRQLPEAVEVAARPLIWILLLPLSVVALTCLLIAGLTTVVLAVLFALVTVICAGTSVAVFTAAVLLLPRCGDSWHKLKRAEASCPHCYQVMPRPAYRCPGCSKAHRDLRPGRLGLLARRCDCGDPPADHGASRRLAPLSRLPEVRETPPGRAPGRCATSASRSSGTRQQARPASLYSGLDSLVNTTRRAQIRLGFPDEESENQASIRHWTSSGPDATR